MAKKKMGQKFLNFIGIEETDEMPDEEQYDERYTEEEDMQRDMGGYAEDEYMQGKDKRYANSYSSRRDTGSFTAVPDASNVRVLIFKPVSYEDTQSIIDNLKENKPIILNLDELDTEVAQRILDFVSGAVYALSGNIRKAARNIFVIAPNNVDISTNLVQSGMVPDTGDMGFNYNYLDRD